MYSFFSYITNTFKTKLGTLFYLLLQYIRLSFSWILFFLWSLNGGVARPLQVNRFFVVIFFFVTPRASLPLGEGVTGAISTESRCSETFFCFPLKVKFVFPMVCVLTSEITRFLSLSVFSSEGTIESQYQGRVLNLIWLFGWYWMNELKTVGLLWY